MNYNEVLNHAWQAHLAPKSSQSPTVISTFAGCGGSSLGYSMAGFRELLAVEWDEHAVRTFKVNFPPVPVYHGDIAQLSVEQCLNTARIDVGELDVFDGSPPCFPSGTMILTNEGGERPIETMMPGKLVLTHAGVFQRVTQVYCRPYVGKLLEVILEVGKTRLRCTPHHPLYVQRRMSAASELAAVPEWIAASDLRAGDLVLKFCARDYTTRDYRSGTWLPIERIEPSYQSSGNVYNLEVENDHSYVANGFAVHNCQGFSTSGKRQFSDNRNQLFKEYVRLLQGLKPKVFVMENVSGMVKGKMKLIFAEILRELKACGYQVSARLLNASHYGVPQARERMIFIGVRNDFGIAPTHPLGRFAPITVKEALHDCTPSEIVPLTGKNLAKMQLLRPGANAKEKERASLAVFGKVSGFTLLRIKWHAPAPTILKTVSVSPTFGAGLIMPNEDRYVSIAELKRLGSFPDEFQLEGTFEERWARIGNSVPPLLMRAIAEHIKDEILARVNAPSKI
ncbi:DNA (cytosine-5-)-methyltransferase [candidate division KSB1 bacterium]|nr:DNA (cytosine-5-)-methyltransferase [candidate division KSB1 bacterium]